MDKAQKRKKIAIIPSGEYIRYNIRMDHPSLKEKDMFLPDVNGGLKKEFGKEEVEKAIGPESVKCGFASAFSPKQRAQMLYDAIFVKKIDYISITGGRGNDYTIIELNKLVEKNNPQIPDPLPVVYGMSDATNMLNYLGQRGYARPFISQDIYIFENDVDTKKQLFQKIVLPSRVEGTDNIKNGVLIPEYSLRSHNTPQEMKLFKDRVNFLATEICFKEEAKAMMDFYKNIPNEDRKNIVFCMSAVGVKNEGEVKDYIDKYKKEQEDKIRQKQNSTRSTEDSQQRELGELQKRIENLQRNLVRCLKHNKTKFYEQSSFKNWCVKNGFGTIESVRFGHGNNPDQYMKIPAYCECTLSLDKNAGPKLEYSHRLCKMNNENSKGIVIKEPMEIPSPLIPNKNYLTGGYRAFCMVGEFEEQEKGPPISKTGTKVKCYAHKN